jgi:hypothetical protein
MNATEFPFGPFTPFAPAGAYLDITLLDEYPSFTDVSERRDVPRGEEEIRKSQTFRIRKATLKIYERLF